MVAIACENLYFYLGDLYPSIFENFDKTFYYRSQIYRNHLISFALHH